MKFSITRFEKKNSGEWNQFVEGTKNGLFLFNRSYMDYHEDRYMDHSLLVHKGGKLIAVLPANESKNKIFSHAGLTFGGLLYSNELRAGEAVGVIEKVIAYYNGLGFEEMLYKAIPFIFCQYLCQEDLYALFRQNAVIYRRDISSAIDLSQPLRFSETRRQAIDKCGKMGLLVTENNDFSEYWQLLDIVLEKFGVKPVHSLDEICVLKQHFTNQIRLFEARLDGELLAGVVVYDFGKVVHTQYMANSAKGRNMGALDFVNSFLINSKYSNRSYFSFGISTEEEGKVLNEGLIQQKEMMGGRAVVNDFYKIQLK